MDEFQLIDFTEEPGKSLGLYPSLAAAQSKVTSLGLVNYEIHLGDQLVDFGAPDTLAPSLVQSVLVIGSIVFAVAGVSAGTFALAILLGA